MRWRRNKCSALTDSARVCQHAALLQLLPWPPARQPAHATGILQSKQRHLLLALAASPQPVTCLAAYPDLSTAAVPAARCPVSRYNRQPQQHKQAAAHLQQRRMLPAAAAAAQQVQPVASRAHNRLQPPKLLFVPDRVERGSWHSSERAGFAHSRRCSKAGSTCWQQPTGWYPRMAAQMVRASLYIHPKSRQMTPQTHRAAHSCWKSRRTPRCHRPNSN